MPYEKPLNMPEITIPLPSRKCSVKIQNASDVKADTLAVLAIGHPVLVFLLA
jgi:hypothetical protein